MKTKLINIIQHPPDYDAYRDKPRPVVNWDTADDKWVGIWGYSWPNQLGNAVLCYTDEFEYEVWQPDLRAEKIYSHTFQNGMTHYLFPGQNIRKYFGLKKNVVISEQMLKHLLLIGSESNAILHLNNIDHFFNYLILKNTNLPTVIQMHSKVVTPVENRLKFRYNFLKNFYYNKVYNILKSKNNLCFVYNNSFSGEQLSSFTPMLLERIFLGISFDKWISGNKLEAKNYYKCKPDELLICLVSRFVHLKQIDKILEIFTKLNDHFNFKILIAGHGSYEYTKYLRSIGNRLINSNKLEFLGYRNENDLLTLYQASDLFISSSQKEGGPVSAINAFACEVPVFCTRVGGVDDIMAEHNAGILVDPFDYKQWEKEFVEILKGRKIGILDRDIAKQHFHWPNIAKKFARIYASLREVL